MRIKTLAGTNIEFENDKERPIFSEGAMSDVPGEYMLIGQVDWAPIEETINSTIVLDGAVWPPNELGLIKTAIVLEVKQGRVEAIRGGREAKMLEKWLAQFQDPAMYNLAHVAYGCNPGAKLSGQIVEDERVWGSVEWGLGYQAQSFGGKAGPAKSHTDGICLETSIWMDDEQVSKDGHFTHKELAELEEGLKNDLF